MRTNLEREGNPQTLPDNLTDANEDGRLDEGDFVRGFTSTKMSIWEIGQLFTFADINRSGDIDINEWRMFHSLFIKKFQALDKDHNLRLSLDELVTALSDIHGHPKIFEDKKVLEQIMNDLSGSNSDDQSLNLFEYVFLRATADAWTLSAGNEEFIQRDQLLDIGLKFMPHMSAYEGQLKNVLFEALDFQNFTQVFDFVETLNLYHKFLIFESMRKHNSINGTLTQRSMTSAINDRIGPSRLFEV